MTLLEIAIVILASIGVLFTLISAIGIVRLPDVYARMHAAGKASTLGVSCLLLCAGLYYGQSELWRMVIFLLLFFITGPIATTAMARAAYRADPEHGFVLHYDEMKPDEMNSQGASADHRAGATGSVRPPVDPQPNAASKGRSL
jgi:multicomponent Na+:H+ antiporter subunit G